MKMSAMLERLGILEDVYLALTKMKRKPAALTV